MRAILVAALVAALGIGAVTQSGPSIEAQVAVEEHCHQVLGDRTGPPIVCEVPTSTTSTPPSSSSSTAPPTTSPPSSTVNPTTTTTSTLPPSTTAPPTSVPASSAFAEDFASPASMDRFVEHTGNYCAPGTSCRPEENGHVASFPGDHDLACGGPTTVRTVNVADHDNLFWWCAPGNDPAKGHVMIGNDMSGYGIVSLSPNQTFNDIRRVCWSVNLTDLGGGKWFNVVIVPEAFYLAHPNTNPRRLEDGEGPYRMDYTSPGFNDDNAPGDFNVQGGPTFGLKQFRGTLSLWANNASDSFVWTVEDRPVVADKTTRYRHCLTDTAAGVVVEQAGAVWTVPGVHMPNGPVRVVFQDDTYDAIKHDGIPANKTWHLDDIVVEVEP